VTQQVERYPLSWPQGWKRTPPGQRKHAQFKTVKTEYRNVGGHSYSVKKSQELTVAQALRDRLLPELRRLGVADRDVVVSSDIPVRNDGMPYSNERSVTGDPGVAVYFKRKGKNQVLACDTWLRVADNLAAIAGHIEALRTIDRYGVGTLDQAFAGYQALPAQASPWWTVLEFEQRPTLWSIVEARHLELVRKHHPDRGGSPDTMAKINAARDAARIDLSVTALTP
jgi:hypothetical protein